MTTKQNNLFEDGVSISDVRKQRKLEASRKRYREKLSKDPVFMEANRKRASAYYKENKEKCDRINKEWAKSHPEGRAKISKRYYENNIDKLREYSRKKFTENAESYRDRGKKWRQENPEKNALKERRRRSRKKGAGGEHTIEDINRLKVIQNGKCAVCKSKLGKGYHVDHVMPLALGGSNDASNLQLLCPPCNMSKSAKHPVDFMQERGFLL